MIHQIKSASFIAMAYYMLAVFVSPDLSNERLQNANEGFSKTVATEFVRLRLATLNGQPPFGFLDRQNNLSGFNLDLARRLCFALPSIEQCEIQAIREDEAASALNDRTIDVAIGIFNADSDNRSQFYFTRPYHRPSHYKIIVQDTDVSMPSGYINGNLTAQLVANTLNDARLKGFDSQADLLSALARKELKAGLVDSIAAQFWLLSDAAKACCRFEGPYYLQHDRDHQHHLAMRQSDVELHKLVSQTLRTLEVNGDIDEIRRRYFPLFNASIE